MAEFLYDRMSKFTRRVVLGAMLALYLTIVGAIIYVIIHFVTKYW